VKVQEYVLEDGSSPFKAWFDGLAPEAAVKVATTLIRMERGLVSAINWFGGIGEYKIDWGPGIRIYLAQDGAELIILFGGGTKKHQSADIEKAKLLHQQYKGRKKELKSVEKKMIPKSAKRKK
jgi:putative addiction module killer protein